MSTETHAPEPEPEGLRVHGPVVEQPSSVLRSRPVLAVTLLAVAGVLELLPSAARFRLLSARPEAQEAAPATMLAQPKEVGEAELGNETTTGTGADNTRGRSQGSPIAAQADDEGTLPALDKEPPVPMLDPSGKALEGFFHSLDRVRKKEPGAIAGIAHFGDSIVVSDLVSGTLRRKFQGEFGDAG